VSIATAHRPKVDIFTAEVIRNGLTSAAVEMAKALRRTAHNTLLYDVQDYGVGLVSADGALLGEAPGISIFLGCLPEAVRSGLRKHGADGFEPGDVLVANDPYETGTHISDVSVYTPIFADGELLAFAISTAHWADIGAKAPGGWCPDTTDVYQEGICFSHQKLIAAGEPNRDLWELIDSNVRLPSTVRGDLDAQIACCRLGGARTLALVDKYGVETIRVAMAETIARTEADVARRIAEIPDGTYGAAMRLDFDGVVQGTRPLIRTEVTVDGERLSVSYEGSDEAARGPINLPAIGTKSSAQVALKALLMPLERTNDGHFRGFEFEIPAGLVVGAERPNPCDSYGYVKGVATELVFRALGQAIPERVPAGGLQLLLAVYSRTDPRGGEPFLFTDPIHGGNGSSMHRDGATLMRFDDGDAPNTPIEVAEMRFPLLCERYELRARVAGPGRNRGGFGVVRDFRMLEPGIYLQTGMENTIDVLGKGLAGGAAARPSTVVVWPGTERERRLEQRVSDFGPFEAGDVVSMRSAGGGGWGDPFEREPERVLADVIDQLISPEQARDDYGVVVAEQGAGAWTLDSGATVRLRGRRRRSD
jgi:N-methylhydantoinase B